MTTPLISVIVTSYQRRELLVQALASVLAQTLDDREVIVADDGSTAALTALATQLLGAAWIAASVTAVLRESQAVAAAS